MSAASFMPPPALPTYIDNLPAIIAWGAEGAERGFKKSLAWPGRFR